MKLCLTRLDGPTNMALDRALLETAEREGIVGWRVYGWDGPWLTMGMNQDPAADLLPTNPVPWVIRPTGGNAVLHGHDVTVGFAAPLSAIWPSGGPALSAAHSRSVRGAYRWVTRPVIGALCACGLPSDLAENVAGVVTAISESLTKAQRSEEPQREAKTEGRRANGTGDIGSAMRDARGAMDALDPGPQTSDPSGAIGDARWAMGSSDLGPTAGDLANPQSKIRNPRFADCFAGVSRNDIVGIRTGLKCCGCAFRMTRGAVLLQASIPAGPPLVDTALIFAEPSTIVAPDWDAARFPEAFEQALSLLQTPS